MIKAENVKIGKRDFIRTYSDTDKKIIQIETGAIYDEAYDIEPYTYKEVISNQEA